MDRRPQRLGADRNLRWTAFGPTNATLHRVSELELPQDESV